MIPKTVTPSRITENLKATEIKLDAEDMKSLRELESKNFRLIKERVKLLVPKLQGLLQKYILNAG